MMTAANPNNETDPKAGAYYGPEEVRGAGQEQPKLIRPNRGCLLSRNLEPALERIIATPCLRLERTWTLNCPCHHLNLTIKYSAEGLRTQPVRRHTEPESQGKSQI
ncbi:hypothetical protein Y1Q_0006520 [Alligator mississippiensis]|uniref:Uncharacterized protein n=1 Tax=Alligator mississippiensis TaxID=8496 RepID=A0A151M3S5_ALLMI|nr:hypothetical protein Y1Q_0006520 [Alligator mississippiensis]